MVREQMPERASQNLEPQVSHHFALSRAGPTEESLECGLDNGQRTTDNGVLA